MIYIAGVKVVKEIVYYYIGNPDSVSWCITSHFIDNLFAGSVCMHIAALISTDVVMPKFLDAHRKILTPISNLCGISYACYAFAELTYIGVTDLELYRNGMFEQGYELSHSVAVLVGIVSYLYLRAYKAKKIERQWV